MGLRHGSIQPLFKFEKHKILRLTLAGSVVNSQDDLNTSQLVCKHARWCNNSDWSAPLLHPLVWPCEGRLSAASCFHPSSYRPVSLFWPLVPMCHYIMLQFDSVTAAVQLQPCEHLTGFSALSQTVTCDVIVSGGSISLPSFEGSASIRWHTDGLTEH